MHILKILGAFVGFWVWFFFVICVLGVLSCGSFKKKKKELLNRKMKTGKMSYILSCAFEKVHVVLQMSCRSLKMIYYLSMTDLLSVDMIHDVCES